MKLLIVESSTKAHQIAAFLDNDWRVEASRGQLRDLPETDLGVDVKHNFTLDYKLLADHRGTLVRLKKLAGEASAVYLATDPDREGEGIAWHLAELLKSELHESAVYRVTVNAITPAAVMAGIAAPRQIDQARVDAQQARRTLDRLIGYLVSPLACQKLNGRYSAGRLPSACLRLVIDREYEITAFKAIAYWILDAQLTVNGEAFTARLNTVREFRTMHWPQGVVKQLVDALHEATFTVADVKRAEAARQPAPPFTTATLQQAASKALHLTPDQTMQAAQYLYERGYITFMRTDAVFVPPEAQVAARSLIHSEFGPLYVPSRTQMYSTSRTSAEEVSEAIRPTDVTRRPETLVAATGRDLYTLIWKRFVASQMGDARYLVTAATLHATKNAEARHPAQFLARSSSLLFDGFLKVYEEPLDESESRPVTTTLPALAVGQVLKLEKLSPIKQTTEPPSRYTDAGLIAALEAKGIGRPSTYASMVRLLRDKGYVKVDGRRLAPTAAGTALNDFLAATFPTLFGLDFTAKFEAKLDQVAASTAARGPVLSEFWKEFEAEYRPLAEQFGPAVPTKAAAKVLGICPKCGGNLVERRSKSGVFAGCANFPHCKGRAELLTFIATRKGAK
ncbi:MAG: type I DNA topoisomerase [Aggregatilineales bacterium]